MATRQALVIGTGPFGLSISAQLRRRGVDHQIVGRTVDTWRQHMPQGMLLKSEPYGSDFAVGAKGYDVEAYCKEHNLDYQARLGPLTLERFLGYADWFIKRLVPDVEDLRVTEVTPVGDEFRVKFADAAPITTRQVIVATGLLPYRQIAPELAELPADLVTHTSDHHDMEPFRGRRVAVVGKGQSALEVAALLHEAGADVVIVARGEIGFAAPNPATLTPLEHIRWPVNKLCEGWHCMFWNSPEAFGLLPEEMRVRKAKSVLGPLGAWWLKDRVQGVIEAMEGYQIRGAAAEGSGVRLTLEGPSGMTTLDVDHVVSGTGYRVDLARLPFLAEPVRDKIKTLNRYPLVSRAGQSSVPGLYFAGAHTAVNLGPSVRFIAGTHQTVAQLTRSVARRAGRRGSSVSSASPTSDAAMSEIG